MDAGNGRFHHFEDNKLLEEAKQKLFNERMRKKPELVPVMPSSFTVGDEIEVKNSKFKIAQISKHGMKLNLMPIRGYHEEESEEA